MFFNLASTLSSFIPYCSSLCTIALAIGHGILALRSLLYYNLYGLTLGFLFFFGYNTILSLYFTLSIFLDPYIDFSEPDTSIKKSKYYYRLESAVLYADVILQVLFGVALFYNRRLILDLLPTKYTFGSVLRGEEDLIVSNAG